MKPADFLRSLLLLGVASAASAQSPLTLFNGTSLQGWNNHGAWAANGGSLTTNGGGNRYILTAVPFGDFSLEFEYTETASMAATFRMWASHENNGGLTVDLDYSGAKSGVGGIEVLGKSSMANISAGGWHKVQVEASHGKVTVQVDGRQAGSSGSDLGARAGYIGFEAGGDGQLTLRNVHLRPLNLNSTFNGTDLGGWKSIPKPADTKGGVGHSAEKMMTFGLGGGTSKPHEAKWTVRGGAIHGEAGPGALENSTPVEDGLVQITANIHGDSKPDNFTPVSIRNTAGQYATGYAVGIGPYAGIVDKLNKLPFGKAGTAVEQTVAVGGRVVETWVNGNIVSVVTDSRPESANAQSGAKTQGGSTMLVLPNGNVQMDVSRINLIALGKPYGATPRAPAPPPVATVAGPAVTAPAASAGDSAAAQALAKQQAAQEKKIAEDQQNRDHVASLMTQALASTDAAQQKDLYGQVMHLDPANPNAMQGYKEAQAKLQQQQTSEAQVQTQQQDVRSKEEQTNSSLVTAQSAFLGGHLSEASNALSVAERLSPGNPLVRELRSRIAASQAVRSRLYFLAGGTGLIAAVAALTLWFRRRKTARFPMLEVTSGLDSGRTYRLEKDQTRIGAVPQDGGQKNDIVVRDVEHAISRFHCEVVKRNGQLYLQDLNSSNGTRVDGERLKPGNAALLRKGTRIQLAGTVEMRFGYDKGKKA
ncbi:MAG: family 16 glycoside hydrolase [Janthinobacterium lividum]